MWTEQSDFCFFKSSPGKLLDHLFALLPMLIEPCKLKFADIVLFLVCCCVDCKLSYRRACLHPFQLITYVTTHSQETQLVKRIEPGVVRHMAKLGFEVGELY
jgi:hypothetical protein